VHRGADVDVDEPELSVEVSVAKAAAAAHAGVDRRGVDRAAGEPVMDCLDALVGREVGADRLDPGAERLQLRGGRVETVALGDGDQVVAIARELARQLEPMPLEAPSRARAAAQGWSASSHEPARATDSPNSRASAAPRTGPIPGTARSSCSSAANTARSEPK
jgi:hypothetical protein